MPRKYPKELYSFKEWVDFICPPYKHWKDAPFNERKAFALSAGWCEQPDEYPCVMLEEVFYDSPGDMAPTREARYYYQYLSHVEESIQQCKEDLIYYTELKKKFKKGKKQ